jgi:hypothetical protein
MMKVVIISLMMLVPLVGVLFGDRYFTKWFCIDPEATAEGEEA